MKARKWFMVLMVGLFIVSACGTPVPTQVSPVKIEVTNITENDLVMGEIIQTKTFDQCHAASPFRTKVEFSDTTGQASQKALTLIEGGKVGVEVPSLAKIELAASLQEHFSYTKNSSQGHTESVDIEVPAKTKQEYSIVWREMRREGTVDYTVDGEKKFANYSYRIGVEFVSSLGRDVSCFETPTLTPLPTETPTPESTLTPVAATATATPRPKLLADGCISSAVWKVDSTDTSTLQDVITDSEGCYLLGALGFSANQSGVLKMFQVAKRRTVAAGIYLPVSETSNVQFKIRVNHLYIVYADPPTYINFAIAPASAPMTGTESARFRLYVNKNDQRPLISFMMADVGESTGSRIESRHYEYGRTYTIRFELAGSSMRVFINDVNTNEILLIPAGQKVFYVGYNLPTLAGVDAEIMDVWVDGVLK